MSQAFEGGVDMFSALAYGQPHPGTIDFLQRQFSNVSTTMSDMSRRFHDKAQQALDKVISSDSMRLMRAASRRVKSVWQSDEIHALREIGEIQHAKPQMQRWIMAHTQTRELYHDQRIDGYSDSYVDYHENDVGESHYDYRRVMNGIVVDDDEGYSCTTYFEDLVDEDRELDIDEQYNILSTWHYLERYLALGKEDPTSVYNAALG